MEINIVILYDENFPFSGERPDQSFMERTEKLAKIVTADKLKDTFANDEIDCLINMHGPYFPKNAWNELLAYLKTGKGFIHLGGIPFRIPCHLENGEWVMEREQTAHHQLLNIHEALEVKSEPIEQLKHNPDIPVFKNQEYLFTVEKTYNFILHVSKSSAIDKEMGSSGPMDARIFPLLKGISKDEREVAAPAVLIENMKGDFTGGRWLFVNQPLRNLFWCEKGTESLIKWAEFTAKGVTEMWLKTNYASYEKNERPTITFQLQSFASGRKSWTLHFNIKKNNESCFKKILKTSASPQLNVQSFTPPLDVEPGLYQISCRAISEDGETRTFRNGFWGMDRDVLQSGKALTCDRDYFWKDGRPLPIVGMTYMTSDVARYYLFLPNPHLWDRDFAQMKRAGINYVRTGVWTAWRNMMFIDGHVDEGVLRAIDAFILCAKKYDLEVTFTFFSFLPEMWEGENPYLDPRSLEAQKRFITTIVSRHRDTTNVQWDLINEPSLFDPERSFTGPRPLHDRYDQKTYSTWLKERHASIRVLQERWNMTEQELPLFDRIKPPEPEEINSDIQDMITGKKGLKWLDYTLYTMDMHNNWAKELTQTIKNEASDQLVTVGQDEALAAQRPAPFYYAEVVDYTTNHSWWLLDQLLWDSIFAKSPEKPNLIQETGIMYVEQPNNQAKRTEEELRSILERKYAYAFAGSAAGAVQWLWNTNYYMNNVNESNIGAVRADGTEKPEANVSYDFGAFMNDIRDLFVGRTLEEVAVIFPYSNDFSNRSMAFDATSKLTRTLAYSMKMPFRALGEYHLDSLTDQPPKLIIVPSAHQFNSVALGKILYSVQENGASLLFTGPINLDEYWHQTDRMADLIGKTKLENVLREEMITLNEEHVPVSFGGRRIAEASKEVRIGVKDSTALQEFEYGKGKIFWSPLPVELNERIEPLTALYDYTLKQAGVTENLHWLEGNIPGVYGRKVTFQSGALFVFVSEYGKDTPIQVVDPTNDTTYTFELPSERSILFATNTDGSIQSVYRKLEVNIHASKNV